MTALMSAGRGKWPGRLRVAARRRRGWRVLAGDADALAVAQSVAISCNELVGRRQPGDDFDEVSAAGPSLHGPRASDAGGLVGDPNSSAARVRIQEAAMNQ